MSNNRLTSICIMLLVIHLLGCMNKNDSAIDKRIQYFNSGKLVHETIMDSNYRMKKSYWNNCDEIPYLVIDYTRDIKGNLEQFDEKLLDKNILDTPIIEIVFKNDSIIVLDLVCKNFPLDLMTGIGWRNAKDIEDLQVSPISNSYKIIFKQKNLIKDSTLYFTFDFFNPLTGELIKKIERVNVSL